jgi:hypothetical protein
MRDGGFDCFLGNPPFLGGKKISNYYDMNYGSYIKFVFPEKGSSDLIGYFIRRNNSLLKQNRALGSIATNTLAQGDTRLVCLDYILTHGGTIKFAVRSTKWPGVANVNVSEIAIQKGQCEVNYWLDGKQVNYISSYLDDQIAIGNPYQLVKNSVRSFQGTIVFGSGFILNHEEAKSLMAENQENKKIIFPYINGDDLNSRSDQSPSRYIINFGNWPYDRNTAPNGYQGPYATDYPECLKILIERVKPQRDAVVFRGRQVHEYDFWKFWDRRDLLYHTIAPLERVIVVAQVSRTLAFAFIDKNMILDAKLVVFALDKYYSLSIMQSIFHFLWAWKYCTTMKADLSYTPTAIFQTFPFPTGLEPNNPHPASPYLQRLDALGENLDVSRREIMRHINIGLTKLYNLYHKKGLNKEAIIKEAKCADNGAEWALERIIRLRDIQQEIDEAVRDAYGWTDIPLQHSFYELEFLPENDRVRYTVCDSARRQILQDLLKLNHERHKEEVVAGLVDENGKVLKKKDKGMDDEGPGLF